MLLLLRSLLDAGGVAPPVEVPSFSQEIELRSRYYVKRGKRIFLFNNADEADAWLEADRLATEALEQAQRTSRRARKRLREKVYRVAVQPLETLELPLLQSMVGRYAIDVDLPALIAQEAWDRVMQIHALAMEMQDEDDVLLLLLA